MNILIVSDCRHPGRCLFEFLSRHTDHDVKMETWKTGPMIAENQGEEHLSNLMKETDAVIFSSGCDKQAYEQAPHSSVLKHSKALIKRASHIKVPRFILLSAMGADDPQGPAEDYLYHKREAEDYLKNSGLSYTIIRPGHLIHGGPSGKINMKENMQWIDNADISCGDIALVLKSILDSEKLINKIVEITSGESNIKKAIHGI